MKKILEASKLIFLAYVVITVIHGAYMQYHEYQEPNDTHLKMAYYQGLHD